MSMLFQGHFFDEYAMEGVSEEANEIYLELAPENLVKALKTAQSAKWIKIKLAKKHTPCLTVEVDLVSGIDDEVKLDVYGPSILLIT